MAKCEHPNTRCVHGDEIIGRMTLWRGTVRRQACLGCGRALNRSLPKTCTVTGVSHG